MSEFFLSSTQKLYEKIAKGECAGFTVPAFNIRTLTLDVARALFRAAKKTKTGAFIIELAPSEMKYTNQTPKEYADNCLKAAQAEKFTEPLFLQGDHFKPTNPDLESLIRRAIKAGFYNIDIDCSGLSLQENFSQTARLTNFIRVLEPKNLTISIGGEVGKIGGKNTTPEELEEFLSGVKEIIKVAVQTGTAHGKGGKIDFMLLQSLSTKAKEYGLAGIVQHGASTLPEEQFKEFPKAGVCEIHLATLFQSVILENPYFPQELREKIDSKKSLGILKKEILSMPQKNINKICEELEEKFLFFFQTLNVSDTKDLIKTLYSAAT